MKNTDWKIFAEKISRADPEIQKKIQDIIDRLLAEQKEEKRNTYRK